MPKSFFKLCLEHHIGNPIQKLAKIMNVHWKSSSILLLLKDNDNELHIPDFQLKKHLLCWILISQKLVQLLRIVCGLMWFPIVKLVLLHFRQVIVMKWIYSFCIAGEGGAQALNWVSVVSLHDGMTVLRGGQESNLRMDKASRT